MAYSNPINTEVLLEKIKSTFPQLALNQFEHIKTGYDHDILIVEHHVFRFPKSKYYMDQLYSEARLTEYLASKISARIPIYDFIAENASFARHRIIPGKILTHQIIKKFNSQQIEFVVAGLANFLSVLHNIGKPDYERFGFLKNTYNQPLAEIPNYVPIHSDLDLNNMIWNDVEGLGIIDFGDRSIFDPAFDFTIFPFFGEEFISKVYKKYQGPKDPNFLKRVELYHQRYLNKEKKN